MNQITLSSCILMSNSVNVDLHRNRISDGIGVQGSSSLTKITWGMDLSSTSIMYQEMGVSLLPSSRDTDMERIDNSSKTHGQLITPLVEKKDLVPSIPQVCLGEFA